MEYCVIHSGDLGCVIIGWLFLAMFAVGVVAIAGHLWMRWLNHKR